MHEHGVQVEEIRAVDHETATGVWPDMTDHGAPVDEWPALQAKVLAADILVLAGPIWLGQQFGDGAGRRTALRLLERAERRRPVRPTTAASPDAPSRATRTGPSTAR
jgi:hypothetical protein